MFSWDTKLRKLMSDSWLLKGNLLKEKLRQEPCLSPFKDRRNMLVWRKKCVCRSAPLKTDTYWMQKIQERGDWERILYTILFYKNIHLQALQCLQLKNISSKSVPICLTSYLTYWKYSPRGKTFHGKILRNGYLWLWPCCRNHREKGCQRSSLPGKHLKQGRVTCL